MAGILLAVIDIWNLATLRIPGDGGVDLDQLSAVAGPEITTHRGV